MDGTVRETQLFNLKADPYEFLAEHQKKGKMETLLQSQMQYFHDPHTLWNQRK